MRKLNTTAAPVVTLAAPATPAEKRARKRVATKPVSPARAARIIAQADAGDAAAAIVAEPAPAKPVKPEPVRFGGFTLGNINRTAQTVVAQRTNFAGVTSDRDTAYLASFERVRRDTDATPDGETITLAALAKLGKNPYYTGSAKPHDAGAINRAVKAGNVEHSADGASIKLTARGRELAAAAFNKLTNA